MKNRNIFLIFVQNIDCGYTLVPTIYVLDQKYENHVYPWKPQFYYIKVGCKGVNITRTCYHDEKHKIEAEPRILSIASQVLEVSSFSRKLSASYYEKDEKHVYRLLTFGLDEDA